MRKIALFGSTGSIGTQAIDVISDEFEVSILTAGRNIELFEKQLQDLNPEIAVLLDENKKISERFPQIEFLHGAQGLTEAAQKGDYDILLNAIVGIAGLRSTYEAVRRGKDVALANKESLVAGGSLIIAEAKKSGAEIIPVDSEHSAIYQCLDGNAINRIILTASGGPFRGMKRRELADITPQQALKHPNWDMGNKITIDSATLMNKGLEVIEARWLFDLVPEQIEVLVHPESAIHSIVEFEDKAMLAQLGIPDMRVPIAYALSKPGRWASTSASLELSDLHFEKPDKETFKCLKLAYEVLEEEQSYAVVYNAANELLVGRFLRGNIGFLDIGDNIERVLQAHKPIGNLDIDGIMELDRKVKGEVECI